MVFVVFAWCWWCWWWAVCGAWLLVAVWRRRVVLAFVFAEEFGGCGCFGGGGVLLLSLWHLLEYVL